VSPFAVLALFPLWAVSLGMGLTAFRLGRSVGRGLVLLCVCLAVWVSGLILAIGAPELGAAGRVLPAGMLLAGAFTQAFSDVARLSSRRLVFAMWGWGTVVAGIGLVAPGALYDPLTNQSGPLFAPTFAVSLVATIVCNVWMLRHTLAATGVDRKRRLALFGANVLGAVGGGGVIMLRLLELAPMELASPLLLGAVLLASYAVLTGEKGRHRELLVQGLAFALATAVFSAFGLTVFFGLIGFLVPAAEPRWPWVMWVIFLAALPLDPLRQIVVERIAATLFKKPIGTAALAAEIEQSESRALHAEQLAALGRVASVVAHEIRNPLSVILAQARLLEREGASPERLKDVRDQVQRASRFVDELLRYSKPRTLTLTNVDLHAAHRQAIDQVQQAQGAGFLSLLPSEPVTIDADLQAVTDTATVLLSNAAIAASDKPAPQVTVAIEARPDEVWVRIEDNGPGVPPELEPKLFQMFVTGRGRDHVHPGTGLGLAIAAQHVQRHGGTITHERREGGGARFLVKWPRRAKVFG
jgi:signal transduction histidine kinase